MYLFYILPHDLGKAFLSEEESYHSITVLRYKENDKIHLIDGQGGKYEAIIKNAHAKKCEILITQKTQQLQPNGIVHLAICPPKSSDRLEFLVEKAIEIGVDKISFITSQRSERHKVNKVRLEKIICSAAKQSMRAFFPILFSDVSFEKFISENNTAQKYIAHCYSDIPKTFLGKCISNPNNEVVILIGPEGDFTREEIQQALASAYKSISLGDSRFRTETAALVALNIYQFVQEMNKSI